MDNLPGKHFDLRSFKPVEDFRMYPYQDEDLGSYVYSITNRVAVEYAEKLDDHIVNSIVQMAIENGVDDLYILDKPFILAAIKEKMEREKEKHHDKT